MMETNQPTKPTKLETEIKEMPSGIVLSRRLGSTGEGIFAVFWLSGWSVACIALLHRLLSGELLAILLGMPFWASWFFVFSFMKGQFFDREELIINTSGISYRKFVREKVKISQMFNGSDFRGITSYSQVVDSDFGTKETGIRIDTSGKPIRFGQGLSEDERSYVEYLIDQEIKRRFHFDTQFESSAFQTSSESKVYLPRGSEISFTDQGHVFSLIINRRISWEEFGIHLFINLFWNGIISFFLIAVIYPESVNGFTGVSRLVVAIFLIPFVVIGLVFLLSLVWILLGTISKWIHAIKRDSHQLIWQVAWFQIPWGESHSLASATWLEVLRESKESVKFSFLRHGLLPKRDTEDDDVDDYGYKFAWVDDQSFRQSEIHGLTFGEAEWLKQELLQKFCNWREAR